MFKSPLIMFALLAVALLSACNTSTMQSSQPPVDKEQQWNAARAICLEQAQDMTNSTVTLGNAAANDYFKSCMRTRFHYTDEELFNRGYK